jgi:hypothetical protein
MSLAESPGGFQMPFLVDRSVQALETAELVANLAEDHVLILAGDFNTAPGELVAGLGLTRSSSLLGTLTLLQVSL